MNQSPPLGGDFSFQAKTS